MVVLAATTSTVGDDSVPPGGTVSGRRARIHRMTLDERRTVGNELSADHVIIARGYSELDWSALGLLAAEEAGLDRQTAPPR
jgi:hypothetical protein